MPAIVNAAAAQYVKLALSVSTKAQQVDDASANTTWQSRHDFAAGGPDLYSALGA